MSGVHPNEFFVFILELDSIRYFTMSRRPFREAESSAFSPLVFFTSLLTPDSMKHLTNSISPFYAAKMRGVQPLSPNLIGELVQEATSAFHDFTVSIFHYQGEWNLSITILNTNLNFQ